MAIAVNYSAPKNNVLIIDRSRATDPITVMYRIQVKNQGTTTVYYKIKESSALWNISSPTDGILGSLGAGASSTFTIELQRALPTSDVKETIPLTIEVYSDSGYTNLVDSIDITLTVIIADISSWPSYTKYDFDDGTTQGVTFTRISGDTFTMDVSSDRSITSPGFSLKIRDTELPSEYATVKLTKTITLPNTSTCVFGFHINRTRTNSAYIDGKLAVQVNGEDIYIIDPGLPYNAAPNFTSDWGYVYVDLSDYAGQSVVIDIYMEKIKVMISDFIYFDEFVVAGTNAL